MRTELSLTKLPSRISDLFKRIRQCTTDDYGTVP